jgi:trans-aconitate methyltransferase
MLARIPEPEELMDDPEQALAYARADFSEPNQAFVALVEREARGPLQGRLLDLGCGPADIPIALANRHPGLAVDALDGAQSMLDLAAQRLATTPDIAARIRLVCSYLPCDDLAAGDYRFVVSNSLLHHLLDPAALWQTVRHAAAAGARVVVMDLARPDSETAVDALVETHAHDAPDVLRRDFRNSLFAAYTVDEVEAQLRDAGLGGLDVAMVSDRHLAVTGRLP